MEEPVGVEWSTDAPTAVRPKLPSTPEAIELRRALDECASAVTEIEAAIARATLGVEQGQELMATVRELESLLQALETAQYGELRVDSALASVG